MAALGQLLHTTLPLQLELSASTHSTSPAGYRVPPLRPVTVYQHETSARPESTCRLITLPLQPGLSASTHPTPRPVTNHKECPMLHHLSAMKLAESYKRLFSDLGGIQNVKRCNLTVRTFDTLGKLRNNYSYHVHQRALATGQPVRRKHAHSEQWWH
ncbi:hypothetical protein BDR04DRAFT_1165209 [Suillus decipiens]|nr:hypothetical protein BDR04DRAFT_1165209 [Suillus decipiens]